MIAYCNANGYILYYGDAQAHLNISRSIIDSIHPGYDQIGTVWLPLLHVLCLPLVGNMHLWSTGLAGAIPVGACFVLMGVCCFAVAKHVFEATVPAVAATACLVLNPNILYLGSAPMTEVVFLAGLFLFLLAFVNRWMALGIVASWWMSATRYDGWFLIPFEALWFALAAKHKIRTLFIFAALASLGPLYWMGHCWWETGNALDFINGPYSAKAIQGGKPYPGWHDWTAAITYYAAAVRDCSGWPLIALGAIGAGCILAREKYAVLLFLCLTPAFYVLSVHSSNVPIFVRELWPHGLYNTRYGTAGVALTAFAAGAAVFAIPRWFAAVIPVLALAPWLLQPSLHGVVTWEESRVNSIARRQWTEQAAAFLHTHYRSDGRVIASFGDLTGIFCRARIPLKEVVHQGSGPMWDGVMQRPDLFHPAVWAVAQTSTQSDALLARSDTYTLNQSLEVPGAPALHIYQRSYVENPIH